MVFPTVLFAKLLTPYFAASCDSGDFLFFPHWWKYLKTQPAPPNCNIVFSPPNDIWLVLLAILDILIRIGGMVAVFMVIAGGFKYMTALGNSEKTASARRSIVNSLIGLAITFVAAALVAFIGNSIGN